MTEHHEAAAGEHHDHGHDAHAPVSDHADPSSYYQVMAVALRELLIDKGMFSAADLRAAIERMDARSPAQGSRVVAHAWVDQQFKQRLLANGSDACREFGIEIGALRLIVVENTQLVHNLIVCTLCSCYPRNLLGLPPDWYKNRAYRSRAVSEPRAVLREFGTIVADDRVVRVHDSTADMRYLVLPMRPEGTEGWSEEQLAALIGRDSMIGVAFAGQPQEIRS
jgi:nitrile hydratase subunit alpha